MITNLICACGVAVMPVLRQAPINRDTINTNVNRTTNIVNQTNYFYWDDYANDELYESYHIATNNYETLTFGQIATLKQRAIIKTDRLPHEPDYEIEIYILKYWETENITFTNFKTVDYFDVPSINKLTYAYVETWTLAENDLEQEEIEFINGENYQTYDDLNQLVINLNTRQTDGQPTTISGRLPHEETITNKCCWIHYTFTYDATLITDNGSSLVNNMQTVYKSNMTLYYSVNVNPSTYEVIDIPGLLLSILGMPFAWISTAFNLTLFPGTPYAINISHIFFAVLGSLILIVVLKKILK